MTWRSAVKATTIPVLIVFLTALGGLAAEGAAADARWPGLLDYVRQHPWPYVIGSAVALSILVVLGRPWRSNGRAEDVLTEDGAAGGQRSFGIGNATFNGTVNINQGDPVVDAPPGAEVEQLEVAPGPVDSPYRPVVLYHMSPFLDGGNWEHMVVDAVERVSQDARCVPLANVNATKADVAAIVIVFSAAQRAAVKKSILAKLRHAREHCPSARLILVAAGLADDPIDDRYGYLLTKQSGHDADNVRSLVCQTEEEYDVRIESHLSVALRVGKMQILLDQERRTSSTDSENQP